MPAVPNYPAQWGAFRFNRLRGRSAWQVECFYHRKSKHTGCKKSFNFAARPGLSLQEAERQCIIRLRHWATSHASFSRQWRHVAFHPDYEHCPDEAALDFLKGSRADISGPAKTDQELDAEA